MNHTPGFTPGPWTIRYAKNMTAISTPKGEMQLSLHGVYDGLKPLSVDVHEWKANAQLIAAAPTMYEALKAVHELFLGRGIAANDPDAEHVLVATSQALAQAEGSRDQLR